MRWPWGFTRGAVHIIIRELIVAGAQDGLAAARTRGRVGGRPSVVTPHLLTAMIDAVATSHVLTWPVGPSLPAGQAAGAIDSTSWSVSACSGRLGRGREGLVGGDGDGGGGEEQASLYGDGDGQHGGDAAEGREE